MSRTLVHTLRLSFLGFGLLLFAACSGDDAGTTSAGADDVSGTASLETLDLDDPYGGLGFDDEQAAFGDEDLLAQTLAADTAGLADDDEDSVRNGDPTLDSPRMRQTYLRILWGRLDGEFDPEADRSEIERLDWSGSIQVSEGVVVLKRTILFERPFDHRLPRDSRDSLAWVSHTGPHFDGILVKIISPVVDGQAQGTVTFVTPQYRTTLLVSELDGLDVVLDVEAEGNAISFQGHVFEPRRCLAGFTQGFWGLGEDRPETDAVEMGRFRGRILGPAGEGVGYLMGSFGLDASGARVMAGKYIARDGRIQGLVGGTWEPAPDAEGMGSFQARWVNRFGNVKGVLHGRYRVNGPEEPGDGFFAGRWQESCPTGR